MNHQHLKSALLGVTVAAISLATASAWAHHSATMFELHKEVTFNGVVKEFQWTNPHSWLQVVAKNGKDGGYAEWSLEMGPSVGLWRSGWKPRLLKAGDSITVTLHPLKDGSYGGRLISVKLPDGRVVDGYGGRAAPVPGRQD